MKKTAAFLSLIFSGFILFAENADLSFFNGTWAPEDQLPAKVKIELSYDEFYLNDSSLDFYAYDGEAPYLGMFKHSGLSYGYLVKTCNVKNNVYVCECCEGAFTGDDEVQTWGEKLELKISVLGDDWIEIEGLEKEPLLENSNKLYRVKEERRKPVQRAVVNDSSVRLRTEPNLKSKTLYLLPAKYEVLIIDKSDNVTEIDGEKWFWYKIRSKYCFDGWIYGKYLDLNSHKLSEEKKIEIENWGFRNGENYNYLRNCEFCYYSDSIIALEELQALLMKIDCSGDVVSKLNSITDKYEFAKINIRGTLSSATNAAILRNIYFSYQQTQNNIRATNKAGFDFIRNKDGSNTIVVKSNRNGYLYGICIGMNADNLEAILGKPKSRTKNTMLYEAENFGLFTFEFYFDKSDNLEKYSCTFKTK